MSTMYSLARSRLFAVLFGAIMWLSAAISAHAERDLCLPAWRSAAPASVPVSDVFAVARADDGFVYFGDAEALHRAEGTRMRSWFPDPANESALPGGRVRALASWSAGLFIGTARGLAWFNPQTEVFNLLDVTDESVFALKVHQGRLFVGHRSGLTVIDPVSHRILAELSNGSDGASAGIYDLEPFRSGVVAIARDRLFIVNDDLEPTPLRDSFGQPIEQAHYAGAVDDRGGLWLSTGKGIQHIPSDSTVEIELFADIAKATFGRGAIRHMDFDPHGRLWFASDNDYARWEVLRDDAQPVLCRRAELEETDRPLPTRLLSWALGDQIVIGSSGRGPVSASSTDWAERIATDARYLPDVGEAAIWSGNLDGTGRLVLGTIEGLLRETEPKSRRFEAVAPEQLGSTQALMTQTGPMGRLWIATLSGLFVVDGKKVERIPLVKNEAGTPVFGAVIFLARYNDLMLAASDNGLVVIDGSSLDVVRLFGNDPGISAINDAPLTPLVDSRTLHVEAGASGIFVTGAQAVHRLDLEKGTVDVRAQAERDFLAGRIYATAATENGDVYIGTANGLVKTNSQLSDFEYITEIDGARLGRVSAVEIGSDGNLWYNSHQGVWRRNPSNDKLNLFSKADGLHTNGPNQGGITPLKDGRIILASPAGITILDPSSLSERSVPKALVTRYSIDGEATAPEGDRIILPPGTQSLSVMVGTDGIRIPDQLRFEYRMTKSGSEPLTRKVGASHEIEFAALEPGSYRLELRARRLGQGGSNWSAVSIIVRPHWWQTRIARAIFVLTLLLAASAILLWRTRRIERHHKLVGDERKRIAQEFHDTFLQEVLGALMMGRTLSMTATDGAAQNDVQQIVGLLENATESARASVKDLTDADTDAPLLQVLRDHDAASLYGKAPPVYCTETGNPWQLRRQRAFFLARAAKEAINNASKHARASRIDIALSWHPFSVDLVIIDDGAGFEPDTIQRGFGLNAMDRLAQSAKANLKIESQPGAGTRIVIRARRYLF